MTKELVDIDRMGAAAHVLLLLIAACFLGCRKHEARSVELKRWSISTDGRPWACDTLVRDDSIRIGIDESTMFPRVKLRRLALEFEAFILSQPLPAIPDTIVWRDWIVIKEGEKTCASKLGSINLVRFAICGRPFGDGSFDDDPSVCLNVVVENGLGVLIAVPYEAAGFALSSRVKLQEGLIDSLNTQDVLDCVLSDRDFSPLLIIAH